MSRTPKIIPSEYTGSSASSAEDQDSVVISLNRRFVSNKEERTTADLSVDNPEADQTLAELSSEEEVEASSPNNLQSTQSLLDSALAEVDLPADAEGEGDEYEAEIKAIYIEEAQEVLQEIRAQFSQMTSLEDSPEALTTIRRGFHTLKGSGRMVGAYSLAELAWAIENMLNRVLDNSIAPTFGMWQLLSEVINEFSALIDCYQYQTDYPETVKVWMAAATLYANNKHPDFDYAKLAQPEPVETVQSTAEQDAEELKQLFISEVKELIESIEAMSQAASVKHKGLVKDELVRAFHTLTGAASSQSSHQISAISAKIESGLQKLQQKGETITVQHLQVIAQAVQLLKYYLQQEEQGSVSAQTQLEIEELERELDESLNQKSEFIVASAEHSVAEEAAEQDGDRDVEYTVAELIEGIDELLDAEWELRKVFDSAEDLSAHQETQIIDYANQLQSQSQLLASKVTSSAIFNELLTALQQAYQAVCQFPRLVQEPNSIETLIAGHEQLTGLFDSLAGKMALQLNPEAVQGLYRLAAKANTLKHQSKESEAENEADQELLAIFVEEAQELSEESQQQLLLWRQAPDDLTPVKVLQRHLHTLKGGARMASIEAIAELSHEAETLYDYFVDQQIIPTEDWVQVMQSVQDVLSDKIEHLARHNTAFSAPEMVQQLRLLAQSKSLVKDNTTEAYSKIVSDASEGTSGTVDATEATVAKVDAAEDKLQSDLPSQDTLSKASSSTESLFPDSPSSGITTQAVELPESVTESEVIEDRDSIELDFEAIKSESWDKEEPDPEILAVFLEEAAELLPSFEVNFEKLVAQVSKFKALASQQNQSDAVEEAESKDKVGFNESSNELPVDELRSLAEQLQHELHLLQGGVNMVHATAASEVIEALQKVYLKIEKMDVEVEWLLSLALGPLHSAHDWLQKALYLLQHSVNPPKAPAIVKQLKAMAEGSLDSEQALPVMDASLRDYVQAIEQYQSWREARLGLRDISEMPPWLGEETQAEPQSASQELIRVPSRLMEEMIDLSGEAAISRSRIELSMSSVGQTLDEMEKTVQRLAEQLRQMDIELEAQVRSQIEDRYLQQDQSFDPLEMDQYSALNQLSKSLSESASDLLELKSSLYNKTQGTESLLFQLSQSQTQLHEGLMTSRMVSFSRLLPRLQRTVRQTANELGKSVKLEVTTEHDEIDRTVLERLTAPLEHMLRNSVDHGIELPEQRDRVGKPSEGQIIIEIKREGSEIVIRLKDDGRGIDVDSVRHKAISRGLIDANDTSITDLEVMQYIFHAGLSTASSLTQISGRGVGMDVVLNEVRRLGGSVTVYSESGRGSEFVLRLPLTLAVAEALVVRSGSQIFAIPLLQIERVERVPAQQLLNFYYPQQAKTVGAKSKRSSDAVFKIAADNYRLRHLNQLLQSEVPQPKTLSSRGNWPVLLLKNQAGQNLAVQVDEIIGSRTEVVVKPLGDLLSSIPGLSAATITAEGSVMLILDTLALMREADIRETSALKSIIDDGAKAMKSTGTQSNIAKAQSKPQILIVDDSVTVRKVTSRLLQRQGYDTHVARDGVEAIEILQTLRPDLMLLDIEMPRMDGFEVASHVRHNPEIMTLPIIMITSRTGEKHREKARQIGVNDYMGKPFQESALIASIQALIKPK